jgi:enoyl-CoA hydratase/carnithine racemase
MSGDSVFMDRNGPVATIHLNRPAKHNALSLDMWRGLQAAVEAADQDPIVKLIVVTGEGGAFAAGADIEEFGKTFTDPDAADAAAQVTYQAQKRLYRAIKPTIAKISGACVGGGCGIALCCDMRFADNTARFGITPAKLGLYYTLSDTKRLVDAVGPSRAKGILYTGRILEASEAYSIGLIDHLVAPEQLESAVADYAAEVCSASQFSVRATKQVVQDILDGQDDDGPENLKKFADAFSGEDFKEGHAAFMEKRKPKFRFS